MIQLKKSLAFAMAFLLISAGILPSMVVAGPFDKTKSAVTYCSKPLAVVLPVGITDYQYFVYVNDVDSSPISLNFDKGGAVGIENLYPGNHAQLTGSTITVDWNTSFILHNLGGSDILLSGPANVQLVPSDKCDALATVMMAAHEYEKQNNIDKEGMIPAQIGLVTAITGAVATMKYSDVIGYEPLPKDVTPAVKPYDYNAATIVTWLEDNGYRGQKFLDSYNNFLTAQEAIYPDTANMLKWQRVNYLTSAYDNEWLGHISGQISGVQESNMKLFSDSLRNPNLVATQGEINDVLNTMLTEKIYKHSSDPLNWLSLTEYLDKADAGLDVEYKIVTKMADPKYDVLVKSTAPVNHLQIYKKSTGVMISERPIFAVKNVPALEAAAVIHQINNREIRVIAVSFDDQAFSLQQVPVNLVHEISHETSYALGSFENIHKGVTKSAKMRGSESLAVYDERRFMTEQKAANIPGYEIEGFSNQNFRLRLDNFDQRAYSDMIYEFIRDKYGQATIDQIKAGTLQLNDVVDVNALDSIFRTVFLPVFLDEVNAQADEFTKIYNKEMEIRNAILSGDIENPDIVKINGYIGDLTALENELGTNPLRVAPEEWIPLERYVGVQIANLENYRDAAPALRAEAFMDYVARSGTKATEAANSLSGRVATYANVYGGINKDNVPKAKFDAVDAAATKVLDKTKNVAALEDIVLKQKTVDALDAASNSILKGKVPEELKSPISAAKKLATGTTAMAAGMALVFTLGTKFAAYGEEHNNPYLLGTGVAIEATGIGLTIASVGATIAGYMKLVLPPVLKGLAVTLDTALVAGTIVGFIVMMVVDSLWCAFTDLFACEFFVFYVQPVLTISKTDAFPGDKITYTVSGFNVPKGLGSQEGKQWLLWSGGSNLDHCIVSGDVCSGEFTAPSLPSAKKIFAKDVDNSYLSTTAVLKPSAPKVFMSGGVVTDKGYWCLNAGEWKGEPEIDLGCVLM